MNSELFEPLIFKGFMTPSRAYVKLQYIIYKILEVKVDDTEVFFLAYFFICCSIEFVIWLLVFKFLTIKIDKDIKSVTFSLSCLPHKNTSEQTNINLLKKIQNIWETFRLWVIYQWILLFLSNLELIMSSLSYLFSYWFIRPSFQLLKFCLLFIILFFCFIYLRKWN